MQVTEAKVYMDEFNIHLEFLAALRKLYDTFLSYGAKDTLATQFEKTIQNLQYSGPMHAFIFSAYVKHHKTLFQSMLALAKKTDYTAYSPSIYVCHFLNGIMDPALTQAKLSTKANCMNYSDYFDASIKYPMN